MVEIIVGADCGNSPKRQFLKDLTIAYAKGDVAFVADSVSDDVSWRIVGGRLIRGKDDFVGALAQMKANKAATLTIEKVITHGWDGAVSGELTMEDGTRFAFCDVYAFTSASGAGVRSIDSFVIQVEADGA